MSLSVTVFNAILPGVSKPIPITNLHEAQVFARRWVIRDKDPALKALLRQMEKANGSATAVSAIRQLKQTRSNADPDEVRNPAIFSSSADAIGRRVFGGTR